MYAWLVVVAVVVVVEGGVEVEQSLAFARPRRVGSDRGIKLSFMETLALLGCQPSTAVLTTALSFFDINWAKLHRSLVGFLESVSLLASGSQSLIILGTRLDVKYYHQIPLRILVPGRILRSICVPYAR